MKFFKTFLASLLGSLAALFAAFLLMFAFLGAIASIGSSEPIIPEKAILTINLADGISEQVNRDMIDDPDFFDWSIEERNYMAIREQAYRIARYYGWTLEGGRIDVK